MNGRPAVLFDVDGTLVDSNYHHVIAWQRAFAAVGQQVEARRIHEQIGKDGTALVAELLGDVVAARVGERAEDLHARYYLDSADTLQRLRGTHDLLAAVAAQGAAVVLASSAGEDEMVVLRRILDADAIIDEFTSGGDVEQGKPDPDLVSVALAKAGADAEHAVFVGDAVWDIRAARRLRVPTIALLSGGIAEAVLSSAGAAAVYDDPLDLRVHLDASPIAALFAGR